MKKNLLSTVIVLCGALVGQASFTDTAFGKSDSFACKTACTRVTCLSERIYKKCKKDCKESEIVNCTSAFEKKVAKESQEAARKAKEHGVDASKINEANTKGSKKGEKQAEKNQELSNIKKEMKKLEAKKKTIKNQK